MLVCHKCGIQSDRQYVLFEASDLLKNPWRLTRANLIREGTVEYRPPAVLFMQYWLVPR